jgi:hypothetical protein
MHKETNRFKTYTQLEKTYPTAVFLRMGKSEPLILLRQDT